MDAKAVNRAVESGTRTREESAGCSHGGATMTEAARWPFDQPFPIEREKGGGKQGGTARGGWQTLLGG
ncbi:hypothetical protein E2562_003753 [Oryza meyeriana var. granulata]|uniref:Uncharacterized protein n=1 Tax=Oryza meyeriana var. granulata TaxID=110450 RepID=A0A6G1BR55_9ORYZ|nr:hypothetical protein E2562_003753 [Oryza meyeriana var. granulata]